jgi:hypothetical protein
MADGSSFAPPIAHNDAAAITDVAHQDMRLALAPLVQMARVVENQQRAFAQWMEMNRTLADGMRAAVRRQQDLVLDLAESAIAPLSGVETAPAPTDDSAAAMPFAQAGRALQAMGVAVIEAQIAAIRAAATDRAPVDRAL